MYVEFGGKAIAVVVVKDFDFFFVFRFESQFHFLPDETLGNFKFNTPPRQRSDFFSRAFALRRGNDLRVVEAQGGRSSYLLCIF